MDLSEFKRLEALNTHVPFYHIEDHRFHTYGKIINQYDFTELQSYMEQTAIPEDGNVYMASVSEMENTKIKEQIQWSLFGGMPIEIGYCNGPNSTLNGLEYHKSSEMNIAMTDLVLLLGRVQDIHKNSYDSKKVEAFFVPKGRAIELYATTLHFAPCKVEDEGFKAIVILPAGTNTPFEQTIEKRTEEDELLFVKNKWLIVHPEREVLVNRGAYPGIIGENIRILIE
jgi:ureidoglycolate hydrolase